MVTITESVVGNLTSYSRDDVDQSGQCRQKHTLTRCAEGVENEQSLLPLLCFVWVGGYRGRLPASKLGQVDVFNETRIDDAT